MSNSDNDNNKSRRTILKSIVLGGGTLTGRAVSAETSITPVVNYLLDDGPSPLGNFTSDDLAMSKLFQPSVDHNASQETFEADPSISQELLEFFMPSANAMIPCNIFSNCQVEIHATFEETTARFCLVGDAPISNVGAVVTNVTMPNLVGPVDLKTLSITSGSFDSSSGNWNLIVDDAINVGTKIDLFPGGDGCP